MNNKLELDENLEKLLKEPREELKSKVNYVGFCTVFLKKKNKPMLTFDTLDGFIEGHGKAIALMKGAMGSLDKEIFDNLREYVNQTGELNRKANDLVAEFDKRFRVLVSER